MEIRIIGRSLHGQDRQEAVVSLDQPVIVGRDPRCPLTLFGDGLSRRHFLFQLMGGELVVVDQSVNGTKVNDKWVPREEAFAVKPGDVIEIPNYQITFEPIGSPSASLTVVPAEAEPERPSADQAVTIPARPVTLVAPKPADTIVRAEGGGPIARFLGSFTRLEYFAVILVLLSVLFLILYLQM